jgi:hypothetical protein
MPDPQHFYDLFGGSMAADHVQRILEREWIHLRAEFKRAAARREEAANDVAEAEASMDDVAHRRDEVARALNGMDPAWQDDPQLKAVADLDRKWVLTEASDA